MIAGDIMAQVVTGVFFPNLLVRLVRWDGRSKYDTPYVVSPPS